jgi:hypothetical protein
VEHLRRCRERVRQELARGTRAAPRLSGRFALVRISSPVLVHPLLGVRWAQRLPHQIVIVANDGYLPGRVTFVVRTQLDVDLVDLLRSVPLEGADVEWAFGHAKAPGGSLAPRDFERLLAGLGLGQARAAGARDVGARR